MYQVKLRERDLTHIEMIRVALSEETDQARLEAIKNIQHRVDTALIAIIQEDPGPREVLRQIIDKLDWMPGPSPDPYDTAFAIFEVGQRNEQKNERHLILAENIGKAVLSTINDKEFRGLQTKSGILKMVSDEARDLKLHGGRDKDVVRKIWTTYRGVVHLGMALDDLYDNPDQDFQLLQKAEFYREQLATNRPRNATEPYVSPEVQFQFL